MSWSFELFGWAAALCVVLQACSPSMLPLRIFAVCSNILFVTYAHLGDIVPVLTLHALLLPINVCQLALVIWQTHYFAERFKPAPRGGSPAVSTSNAK